MLYVLVGLVFNMSLHWFDKVLTEHMLVLRKLSLKFVDYILIQLCWKFILHGLIQC